MFDELFEPRLGTPSSSGEGRAPSYLVRCIIARNRAGPARGTRSHFDGSRIGRGGGPGRLLYHAVSFAGDRTRRAVVRTRVVLMKQSVRCAIAHLNYLQREGTQRDGSPGLAYSAREDACEGKTLIARCIDDRHQFRLVVSPEDGDLYEDLKPLVRGFMGAMEKDLGTSLEWAAVNHCDTAHPHSHIILRGRDDLGQDLIIAREYIVHGMPARLAELVTRDLGPREDLEPCCSLRQEIRAERLTSIDRDLMSNVRSDLTLEASHRDPFIHALRVGRMRKLERLGFAEPLTRGCWRIVADVEEQLGRLGDRTSVIRTIERELKAQGIDRPRSEWVIDEHSSFEAVGQVIACGSSREHPDRQFLLIDATDGRIHHFSIGAEDKLEPIQPQSIVQVSATVGDDFFPGLRTESMVAIKRSEQQLERERSGTITVTLLSPIRLERLPSWNGPTWLDYELARGEPMNLRSSGFGVAVRSALAARGQWLIDEQLADERGGTLRLREHALATLHERELLDASANLGGELGKGFDCSHEGGFVSGTLSRQLDLASGRFAALQTQREFTLVPWQAAPENMVGREIGGVLDHGRSWTVGREWVPTIE